MTEIVFALAAYYIVANRVWIQDQFDDRRRLAQVSCSWAARNIRHAVAWVRRMVHYGHASVALLVVTLALVAWWIWLVNP